MTEKSEVRAWIKDLETVADDVWYEATTNPGPGEEVARLFLEARKKVEDAMNVLRRVLEVVE